MKCREVESMLALDDVDAKLDRDGVREHLRSCEPCSGLWPEVAMLVGAAPAIEPAPPRRKAARVVAAAGLAAVAIAGIALREPARSSQTAPIAAPLPREAALVLDAGSSTVTQTTVSFDRGRRYESRITQEVWTAPMPTCLKNGAKDRRLQPVLGGSGS